MKIKYKIRSVFPHSGSDNCSIHHLCDNEAARDGQQHQGERKEVMAALIQPQKGNCFFRRNADNERGNLVLVRCLGI